MQRPILVVGCPRSGTSILRDLLRAHSRITIPPESRLLPDFLRLHGDPAGPAAARRLAEDLAVAIGSRRWKIEVDPADLEWRGSFNAMVAELYATWARHEGKPRWGDKTPEYVTQLPTLLRIWPDAQVIHIIRDPRSVAPSIVPRTFGPSSIRTAAALWRECVAAGRRDGAGLGTDSYTEVRYEELVADPERVLRELCGYLGEEFEPAMLTPDRLFSRTGPGSKVRWREEQNTKVVAPPARPEALDARARAVIAWEAGDLMEELGYGPAGPRRPPRPGEYLAQRLRDRARVVRMRLFNRSRPAHNRELLLLARARLRARIARGP